MRLAIIRESWLSRQPLSSSVLRMCAGGPTSTLRHSLAIALGIANSLGSGGFKSLAAQNDWDAEATLGAYASGSDHRERRRQALDAAFPVGASCS
jgi:hypothetical protein